MRFLLSRGLQGVVVMLIVSFAAYLLLDLGPGDPVAGRVGGESVDKEYIAALRREYKLDDPLPIRYWSWLIHALQGDLGNSTRTKTSVAAELKHRLPASFQIMVGAVVLGTIVGLSAGAASAKWPNGWVDRVVTFWATAGVSVPVFLTSVLAIYLFSVKLGLLPSSGYTPIWKDPVDGIKHSLLPWAIMGWEIGGILARHTRSALLEVLRQDYIRTARAKGLQERRVLWSHALRNSLLPVVTVTSLLVGRLIAGTVIIETMFSIPGIGRYLVTAVSNSDYTVVQSVVLIGGFAMVIASIVADLSYVVLDPRQRHGFSGAHS